MERRPSSAEVSVCHPCRRLHPEHGPGVEERLQAKLNRARASRRAAKGAGEPWDGVTDEAIYERDGWKCQVPACLCPDGRDLDRNPVKGEGRGRTPGKWRRTIDHIIPLGLGGGDVASNKRAAHMQCNRARRPAAEAWLTC